ncbi:YppE family protein [Sporosarcina jeotgali]|uniref:YppE family protein n=1 Tax=Sporosarcina jeotgali TaxID=3020056 RepID=A0ABZ0KYZ9_9BACL|nr:YppE family protein [Sporosarcina sp. B2O-1]WOV85455.1 YppE family protein [Sporosarcina sp. B2O-1]
MRLQQLTEKLLEVCDECLVRHSDMRKENREPDFYTEVKPYADHCHQMIDEWDELVKQWIRTNRPKYVRPIQISTLNDLMKQFTVQSFYQKTGKKRFVQSIQSASYTLNTVRIALEKEKEEGEDAN